MIGKGTRIRWCSADHDKHFLVFFFLWEGAGGEEGEKKSNTNVGKMFFVFLKR